jgi:GNAT superfamily N-acetyltransferase
MTFRPLIESEAAQLVPLGASFFNEAKLPGVFHPERFTKGWEELLRTKVGAVMGAWKEDELVGAAGFVIHQEINTGDVVAGEMFFTMLPGHRGLGIRLFLEAEEMLHKTPAVRILMIHLEGSNAGTLSRFYTRRGYRPLERVYVKDITA